MPKEGAEYRRPQYGMKAAWQPNEQGSFQGAEATKKTTIANWGGIAEVYAD
jgi:hypothetical protein